jgi:hypothetical protein
MGRSSCALRMVVVLMGTAVSYAGPPPWRFASAW